MGRKFIFAKNGSKPTLKEKSSSHVCHPPRGVVAKAPHEGSTYLPCCSMASQCSFSGFQENSVKPRMDESQEKGNKAKP
ncbi:hypothetical protein ONT16_02110 [Prevotella copri]|uniref:Uncharacterized protein n=1 Tax=Segatella copri TaxID=165179 RepID=A0AAP3B9U7_9BACT|nr:hypothetical protein [Segatella copri]MCW4127078.1 hypothetical protein [Segatella copri]